MIVSSASFFGSGCPARAAFATLRRALVQRARARPDDKQAQADADSKGSSSKDAMAK
jgi:hypothetical protein